MSIIKAPRQPGGLVNVSALVERAREVLTTLNDREQKTLRPVIEALVAAFQVQAEINKRLLDGYLTLPQRHAATHKGGQDSIEGTDLPAQITPDDAGAIGLPQAGYAPMLHRHPITTSAASGLANDNTEGTSQAFARADHTHMRDVWVEQSGTHLAYVNALNVKPGIEAEMEANISGSLLTNLWGYWPFDETTGTRYMRAGSGGGDLAESGGALSSVAGKFVRAVSQDGANAQYLTTNLTPVSFNSGLTISVWMNLTATPPNQPGQIVSLYNSAGTDWIFLDRYYDGNGVEFGFRSPAGVSTSAAIPVLPDTGEWHLFCAWWDSTRKVAECQWDNGPIYNTDFTAATSVDITGWTFDRLRVAGAGAATAFHGAIDSLVVHASMLSAADRRRLYLESRANLSLGLVGPTQPKPHTHLVSDLANYTVDDAAMIVAQRMYGG